jgi:hypothetical protein
VAHYTWADVGHAMPFDQFVSFVCHAPPGTAIHREINEGWTVTDHLITDMLEVQDLLLWSKTKAAQENKRRPKRRPRPDGKKKKQQQQVDDKQVMTVEEYMKLTGMSVHDGKGV